MDASALEKALSDLEKTWTCLDHWLTFWIALVVIGLAVEVCVIFKEHSEARAAYQRATIRTPERPSGLMLFLHLLGTGLIVVGVAGEFGVHIRAGKVESDMRDGTLKLVAVLNQDTEAVAGKATKLANDARLQESANQQETARLKKVAEDERFARVNIEQSLAWRRLTSQQQLEIGNTLRRFAGETVAESYSAGDAEAETFAWDIASALHAGRWSVFQPAGVLMMRQSGIPFGPKTTLETGVVIESTDDEASRNASDALVSELTAHGFDANRSPTAEKDAYPRVLVSVWTCPHF